MKPVEIIPGVYDVGVKDWNIRDFHGYSTHMGTSYNAFLIIDEKITLIDTVKKPFAAQFLDNISQIIDPARIDMVISNHTEMDHSGSLPIVMEKIGKDKPILCSKMGQKNLSMHFSHELNYQTVKDGENLNIGKKDLTFLETRMLHWPDSMFTYLNEDRILFSSDAFGQHFACPGKYDTDLSEDIMPHAKKYFANILLPYAPLITKLIERVQKLGIALDIVCPDHGILWKNPGKIIDAYAKWSRQETSGKTALVIYDTMWESTEKMAYAICDGLLAEGVHARPMHLRKWHRSDVMTEIMDTKALIIGSPTLNNGLFPTLADFLTYMKGLKPKNKIAAAFGSYGWSGEAVKLLTQELEAMKFAMPEPGLNIQYVPKVDGLAKCEAFGRKIGQQIIESAGK